jgi:hypothetical protein
VEEMARTEGSDPGRAVAYLAHQAEAEGDWADRKGRNGPGAVLVFFYFNFFHIFKFLFQIQTYLNFRF